MNSQKKLLLIGIIAIIVIIRIIGFFNHRLSNQHSSGSKSHDENSFRDTSHLKLTKHVKCRMDCRHITLEEIKEVLQTGNENYAKSGKGSKGDETYSLEGYSTEHQHIRVVVAPENDAVVVITCIDLDKDWPCDCN